MKERAELSDCIKVIQLASLGMIDEVNYRFLRYVFNFIDSLLTQSIDKIAQKPSVIGYGQFTATILSQRVKMGEHGLTGFTFKGMFREFNDSTAHFPCLQVVGQEMNAPSMSALGRRS
jgi:hypothetical protein